MKKLHIVTVGISLLNNYAKAKDLPRDKVLTQSRQLAEFIKKDPRKSCAEINSLDARLGLVSRKPKDLGVTLVYSQTAGKEGQLTARLIANYLKQRGVKIAEIKLKDIGVPANPSADPAESARLAEAGLIRLYDKIENHVERMRKLNPGLEIEFNATGGYKAETAILYGLGADLGLPVYYLHETYQVPIRLPVCAVPF